MGHFSNITPNMGFSCGKNICKNLKNYVNNNQLFTQISANIDISLVTLFISNWSCYKE